MSLDHVQLLVCVEHGNAVLSLVSQCVSHSVRIQNSHSTSVHNLIQILISAIAGSIKKLSLEEGWDFFPQDALKKHAFGSINPARNDFTFTPVGDKGWTTGKE